MAELTITQANFQSEILESKKTALVDFWAPWCGPCKMLGPVIAEIAEEHPEFTVGKVNVDDEEELAYKYGISSIPCLIVFKDGKEARRSVGLIQKSNVEALVKF